MKNYYIKIYLKRNAKLIAFMSLPISLLFFVVSILYDAIPNDYIFALMPIIVGLLAFLVTCLFIIRFNNIIKMQEEMFNITFNDKNAKSISKTSIAYLSDDWLIFPGSCAFYREYIKSFSSRKYNSTRGVSGYRLIVNTTDGQEYEFHARGTSDIKKFREWKNKK